METMILIFGIGTLIGGGILLWTYTESGKKWLKVYSMSYLALFL